jgi:inner membrane protein
MDNLAHTLAGAALGQAGLKRKTGLAMATLMIAANLPDLDAFGLFFGSNLDWRRGWTHGPVALLTLPPLLALAMIGFDRWQERRGKRPEGRLPVRFGWLVTLAYIGAISHPMLDFLNTYGVRFLMPFSDRWFYGDTLFIIDIWMWLALAAGVWLSARRWKREKAKPGLPAIVALTAVSLYVAAMAGAGRSAEAHVAKETEARGLGRPAGVLASPVPINPLRREIVARFGDTYAFGDFRWAPSPSLKLQPALVPTNMDDPAVAQAAAENPRIAAFLYWSRLPFAQIERRDGEAVVTIRDARYSRMPSSGFIVSARVREAGEPR